MHERTKNEFVILKKIKEKEKRQKEANERTNKQASRNVYTKQSKNIYKT